MSKVYNTFPSSLVVADNEGDIQNDSVKDRQLHGLTVFATAAFIVGEMFGSGVLGLPAAIDSTGWGGFLLLTAYGILAMYTGVVLGDAWQIVRSRDEKLRSEHVRHPYPALGQAAFGTPGRLIVSFCINFTLFGGTVVVLLLVSENISSLAASLSSGSTLSFCYICLILAAVLTPSTWLGTPMNFWGFGYWAAGCSSIACILLLIKIIVDRQVYDTIQHSPITAVNFFNGFGTFCYAFGGHASFPTYQADMKDQRQFWKAVIPSHLFILAMYIAVSALGYVVYGNHIHGNILSILSDDTFKYIIQILFTLHFIPTFSILLNPVCQDLEHSLNIPEHFTWKRIVTRTSVSLAVLFVAESIPHFGSVMSLVGGSTVNMLTYSFPPLFYLKICSQQPGYMQKWKEIRVSLPKKVLSIEIVLVGIATAIACTYSAIASLATDKFTVPCYVNTSSAAL